MKFIEDANLNFIFLDILPSTKKVAVKKVIKTNEIDEINELLQKITNRYTVIHSFRHTYATNEIRKLINSNEKSINDIFDLIIKLGHADFQTTLNGYCHIDLLYLLK